MNWKYIKALKFQDIIKEFEEAYIFEFPECFRETVKKYNGARPEMDVYDTDKTKERTIKSLLSFNKDDKETIWKINDYCSEELDDRYIAFAIDHFGNLICFSKSDKSIIFMNMETLEIETIASDFSGFLNKLYKLD